MVSKEGSASSWAQFHQRPSWVDQSINRFLDAACDESRRTILELLIPPPEETSPDDYELRAGEIARQLGLARSTTSEHLRQLLNLHLVSARKEGTVVYYSLRNRDLVVAFHELLRALETHYYSLHSPSTSQEATEK